MNQYSNGDHVPMSTGEVIARLTESAKTSPSAAETLSRMLGTKMTLITPAAAESWLGSNCLDGQRPFSSRTVREYADIMRRGEWEGGIDTIDFGIVDGRLFLINGQHRLRAIVQAGVSVELLVTHSQYPDMEAIARRYGRMDGQRRRSSLDTIRAYGLGAELGLDNSECRRLGTAARYVMREFGLKAATRIVSDQDVALCREWAPEGREWVSLVNPAESEFRKRMRVVGVMSVGIVILRHQPALATGFLQGLATGGELKTDDARHVLRNILWSTSVRQKNQGGLAMNDALLSRTVAMAWNAWVDRRPVHVRFRVKDTGAPIKLAGTPYKGKRP